MIRIMSPLSCNCGNPSRKHTPRHIHGHCNHIVRFLQACNTAYPGRSALLSNQFVRFLQAYNTAYPWPFLVTNSSVFYKIQHGISMVLLSNQFIRFLQVSLRAMRIPRKAEERSGQAHSWDAHEREAIRMYVHAPSPFGLSLALPTCRHCTVRELRCNGACCCPIIRSRLALWN